MKKQKKILIAMTVLVIVLTIVAAMVLRITFIQREYHNQISLGDKYLGEMDYLNAEICYKSAIDINEKPIKPYMQLSNVYSEQEEYDKAYEILKKAQSVDEKYNKNKYLEMIKAQIEYIDRAVKETSSKGEKKQPEAAKPKETPKEETEITYLADYLEMTLSQIWDKYGKNCTYGDYVYYGGTRPVYYENGSGIPIFGIPDREMQNPETYSGSEQISYVDFMNNGKGENSKWPVAKGLMSDMTYQELLRYDPSLTVEMHSDVIAMSCYLNIEHNGHTYAVTYFWPESADYNTIGAERVELMIPYGDLVSVQTSPQPEGNTTEDYYAHLEEVETQANTILNSGQQVTTVDINDMCNQVYTLWDNELNYVYQELKKILPDSEFQVLRQEELDWINYRDTQAEAATAEFRTPGSSAVGSGATAAYISRKTEVTKERVYELAKRWLGY